MNPDSPDLLATEQLQATKDLLTALQSLQRSQDDLAKKWAAQRPGGSGQPPRPQLPFNAVEFAKKRYEREQQRGAAQVEYEKLNPPKPPPPKSQQQFDPAEFAKQRYAHEQQRAAAQAEYEKLNPPKPPKPEQQFDPAAAAKKLFEKQEQSAKMRAEYEKLPQVQAKEAAKRLRELAKESSLAGKGLSTVKGVALGAVGALGVPMGAGALGAMAVGIGKGALDWYEHTAEVANPNLAGKVEGSKKMFEIQSGAERGDFSQFKAGIYQYAAAHPESERAKSLKFWSWGSAIGIPDVQIWKSYMFASEAERRRIASVGTLDKAGPGALESGAMNRPTTFSSFEDYHDRLTTAGSENGPLENANLVQQIENMTKALQENTGALNNKPARDIE